MPRPFLTVQLRPVLNVIIISRSEFTSCLHLPGIYVFVEDDRLSTSKSEIWSQLQSPFKEVKKLDLIPDCLSFLRRLYFPLCKKNTNKVHV